MRRVIGQQLLTFEELSTLLVQIEFCLNSGPLTPLTGDPDDVGAITPWHLIMNFPPRSIPEASYRDTALPSLTRWRLVREIHDHFWSRWSREYLHTLQQRNKWKKPTNYLSWRYCSNNGSLTTAVIEDGPWVESSAFIPAESV